MITIAKLKMYAKYGGDIDMWARAESQKDMNDIDWLAIDGFLQDLSIVRKGIASKDFIKNFEERISESFDSDASIEYLKSLGA